MVHLSFWARGFFPSLWKSPIRVMGMLNYLLKRRIEKNIPDEIREILDFLRKKEIPAFIVGGSLRSLLLNQKPSDWDLAVQASLEKMENLFPESKGLGRRFGTILVRWQGQMLEVSSLREKNIYGDLLKRDFTINALAWNPDRGLYDPLDAKKDLRKKIIRATAEPEKRFREDPLRILRFFRFQSQLNFSGEEKTFKAINPELLNSVAPERIASEMDLLLTGQAVARALEGMIKSGVLETIIPEFKPLFRVPGATRHTIQTVAAIRPRADLRWAAFLHDIAKGHTFSPGEKPLFPGHEKIGTQIAEGILSRLRLSKARQEKIKTLIRWHMFDMDPRLSDTALRRLINKVGRENILDLIEIRRADIIATTRQFQRPGPTLRAYTRRIKELLEEDLLFSRRDLAVDGRDIMEYFDLDEGPEVGELLDKAYNWVLENPENNSREKILNYLSREKNDP